MTQPILETKCLSKRFGAVTAVSDVSVAFEPLGVHAIIGPNGAGKTTLINLLSGNLRSTSGRYLFKERDITGSPPEAVCQLGIGRSYQKTNIFPSFTCAESCRLAAQSRRRRGPAWLFRAADRDRRVREAAARALATVGLEHRATTKCGDLSHGEQRQLEIAMILATEPEVLLLDEPLAGVGTGEADRMIALLRVLAETHTIVLIEHDMDAVFSIADDVAVMVQGRVLDHGPLDQVRRNAAVQEAYLGSHETVQ